MCTNKCGEKWSFYITALQAPTLPITISPLKAPLFHTSVNLLQIQFLILFDAVTNFTNDRYAFGESGCVPRVPPRASILAKIALVHAERASEAEILLQMDQEERQRLTLICHCCRPLNR